MRVDGVKVTSEGCSVVLLASLESKDPQTAGTSHDVSTVTQQDTGTCAVDVHGFTTSPDPTTETWRPIPDHEGYEASDHGRIRSVDRIVTCSDGRRVPCPGKVLTPARGRNGHLYVGVNGRTRYVHQLVLEAFVGPRPAGTIGLHWNDIPADNRPVNLRWGTHADNARDKVRNGGNHNQRKTHCPRGHALVVPNLVEACLPNHRECKACNRARPWCRRNNIPHLMQQVSDNRYARIMGQADAA